MSGYRKKNDASASSLILPIWSVRFPITKLALDAPLSEASHLSTPHLRTSSKMGFFVLALVSLPFASATLYFAYLHITLSRKVQCQTTPYLRDETIAVPDDVRCKLEEYVIHHECARKSTSTASLKITQGEEMLTSFLRHTMTTFSRYPPAWGLWYLTKAAKDRETFKPTHIDSLQFVHGDRVCGVYVVTSKDEGRVTLSLTPPESYTGPAVEGLLIVEVKQQGSQTSFANHTVMWRPKGKGSAGVLEGAFGRWMHGLQVRSLIESGVQQLSLNQKEKKLS
jgi:hypothetical protein